MAAQALQQIAVHEAECGERWKSTNEKMGHVERSIDKLFVRLDGFGRRVIAEDSARAERQRERDRGDKLWRIAFAAVLIAFSAIELAAAFLWT